MQVPSTVLRSSNATIYVVSSTSISKSADTSSRTFLIRFGRRFRARCCLSEKPAAIRSSLRVLEWDKLCDVVSSFSGTSLGRQALKEQLWSLDQTYDDSLRLLEETNAAVEMHKCCEGMLDFTGIDVLLVRSAIEHARRSLPVDGREAMAVATLLQFADALQINIKAAIKENLDQHTRFMPLAQPILDWVISRSLARLILQFVEEDGSIKDSASSKLKQARARVQELERKLHQLMDVLIGSELDETPSLEVSNVDGRWCIRSGTDQLSSFKGLLLSSGAGVGTIVEPLSAVPINDELQQAKASVAEAEAEVLVDITAKMQPDLDVMEKLLDSVIQLDVVNARATYGISFGGACPDFFRLDDKTVALTSEDSLSKTSTLKSDPSTKKWKLYLPKAYHPLLIQQYQHSLQEARKDVAKATAEIRRRRMQGIRKDKTDIDLPSLQKKVNQIEGSQPVPVDILIEKNVRVLLITGPNTGGKTICLKTVGLAAMMAKAGLYVLCSESAQIPWFDSIFADIGDEQSLSQSLSTFSGHLKQISDIQANSTSKSVVLLDEIGAGTNPLEGAALGMSILESFAEAGASLTIATTHHGELKTLKYSNGAFENACMEFDEVNLKPTYKILWGVPGRSNAINIAERLGLPKRIIDNARQLYGTSSAEIDEVVADMEKFKRDAREYIHEAQHYLSLSKHIHEKLLLTKRKLAEHSSDLRYTKIQQISKIAALARSTIHEKMRQRRASARQESHHPMAVESHREEPVSHRHSTETDLVLVVGPESSSSAESVKKSSSEIAKEIPKIGDTVHVPSLGTKAKVLQVELPKKEIVVQAGNLKLKLKLSDVTT